MTIKLYTNNSEVNKINKSITNEITLTGVLRENCSKENPEITIEFPVNQQNAVINSNYAYITEFNRYYYINDITIISNDLCVISLSVDVLMSFKETILNTPMLFERSETLFESFVTDNQKPFYNFPMVLTKAFNGTFNTPSYYLTVANYYEG